MLFILPALGVLPVAGPEGTAGMSLVLVPLTVSSPTYLVFPKPAYSEGPLGILVKNTSAWSPTHAYGLRLCRGADWESLRAF